MATTTRRLQGYLSHRGGSNSFAQSRELIQSFRRGYLREVMPLTTEYAPTNVCNLGCQECPFRDPRHDLGRGRVRRDDLAVPDDVGTSTRETAVRVVEASLEADVRGMLWTGGGEPTIWPYLGEMLRFSRGRGMINGLYTNAVRLGLRPELAEELAAPDCGLAFIRVSVNAVSDAAIRKHWGAVPEAVRPQFAGLEHLLRVRTASGLQAPAIQVSTIVDHENVGDLLPICEAVAAIFGPHRGRLSAADEMVVRPLTRHGREEYSDCDHDDDVIRRILDVCGKGGGGRRPVEGAGMHMYLGFGLGRLESGEVGGYSGLIRGEYARRSYSWANGVFLTVGPDGSVFPSTEFNCRSEWALGNLRTQSVREIYLSRRRREVLNLFHSIRWGPQLCQATARTARLDRIAEAVMSGELDDDDLEQIRLASLDNPPLLLD